MHLTPELFSIKNPSFLLVIFTIAISVVTVFGCYALDVWAFELAIGWIGALILGLTSRRFQFSNFIYVLVAIHITVLAIGAHYTYEHMPLFDWFKEVFGFSRNYYDRVGHFMQGFVPAMILRELLIRLTKFERGKFQNTVIVLTCLGMSAFYEFIEWWMVIFIYPADGITWLGMQGDIWDAQGDMFMAFSGAIVALTLLSQWHDASMKKVMH